MVSKKLTKYDLVELVYQNSKCKKEEIQEVLDCFISELKNSLGRGFSIELRGFGTFEARYRNGRSARNPRTGETISTKPHYVAAFRAGRDLKNALSDLTVNKAE